MAKQNDVINSAIKRLSLVSNEKAGGIISMLGKKKWTRAADIHKELKMWQPDCARMLSKMKDADIVTLKRDAHGSWYSVNKGIIKSIVNFAGQISKL